MNCPRKSTRLMSFFSVVCYVLGGCATEKLLPSQNSSPLSVETPIRLDKSHMPKIGNEFYPQESRLRREEGICVVRMEVDTDGLVRATQLVSSSGSERLDGACLTGFANGQFLPATLNGKTVTTWANIPTAWRLSTGSGLPKKLDDDQITVPIIQKHYQLRVGPGDYPVASRTMQQQGDCTIHVFVKEDGTASNVTVSKSTGFATLDQACLKAIHEAPFIPAHRNGSATGAFADINISWRLRGP
jgi:TonB family protein